MTVEPATTYIDHGITRGTFALDGETFDVENNVWIIGDDQECIIVDAPHDTDAILALTRGRHVKALVCTHAHDDHVRKAIEVRRRAGAPIYLHPADKPLWDLVHSDQGWDHDLSDGQTLTVGGSTLHVLHTPGHAPGAVCLYVPDHGCVFTGDTLFSGGRGATGRSFSDANALERSIWTKLFVLPGDTTVHTGHGDSTTIEKERLAMNRDLLRRRPRRLAGEEETP